MILQLIHTDEGHPQFVVLNNSGHFGPIVCKRNGDKERRPQFPRSL